MTNMTDDPESNQREQKVRERAYKIWESEGRPGGQHQEHWHRARRELDEAEDTAPSNADETPETLAPVTDETPAGAEATETPVDAPAPAESAAAAAPAAKRPRKPRTVKPNAV
jgi:hypothetical protein